MLAAIGSWFTPTLLFCFMNLMIATIFLSYKKPAPEPDPDPTPAPSLLQRARSINFNLYNPDQNPTHLLSRAPSILYERVRSINFNLHLNTEPRDVNPTHHPDQAPDLIEKVRPNNLSPEKGTKRPEPVTRPENPAQLAQTTLTMLDRLWCNPEKSDPDSNLVKSNGPKFSLRRTESEEIHTRKPDSVVRMRKSASEKMEVEEDEEEEEMVELRRQATTMAEDGEVDDKADDFIYKFRQQLKLQRLGSLLRFNEMLQRGA